MSNSTRLVIDFETRSEIDLTEVGASRYSKHPTTIVLCLGYKLPGQEAQLWTPDTPRPKDLLDAISDGLLVHAMNSYFEWCVWRYVMRDRHGWPDIPFEQWRDIMAYCNAIGLPNSLEDALPAAGGIHEKNMEGRRVMLKLTKPRKPSKHNKDKYFNAAEDFQKLYDYCLDDCYGEDELCDRTWPLHPSELEVWQFDQIVNDRGCRVDRQAIEATLKLVDEIVEKNELELELLTDGRIQTAGQRDRLLEFAAELGFPLPNLQSETVERGLVKLQHVSGDNAKRMRRMLEIRQENGKSSVKKYIAMLNRMDDFDDRLRGFLQYCGAYRTGRWAGRGVQPHNLPRGEFAKRAPEIIEMILAHDLDGLRHKFGNPMSAISSAIRGMFIAREGFELICADYNAVEARTVFWLAVDLKGLAVFQSGRDPYKDLSSAIFGVDYNAITDEQRFLGKQAILGLGFRMGWAKFQGTCESYGVLISDELAQRTVNTYRNRYERVVKFWDEVETAALAAIQNPGSRYQVAIFKGFIEYFMAGNFLMCKLPSGRVLGYPDAEVQETKTPWGALKDSVTYMGMNSYTHQWERLATHGGTLVENITQAVARDLLAAAMLRLEKANYPIVLHVHDECISEVMEGTGNLDEYCEIMGANDSWAEGLPVKSEGWIGQRYRKG